MHITDQQFSQ